MIYWTIAFEEFESNIYAESFLNLVWILLIIILNGYCNDYLVTKSGNYCGLYTSSFPGDFFIPRHWETFLKSLSPWVAQRLSTLCFHFSLRPLLQQNLGWMAMLEWCCSGNWIDAVLPWLLSGLWSFRYMLGFNYRFYCNLSSEHCVY